jgi:hypothetical protein
MSEDGRFVGFSCTDDGCVRVFDKSRQKKSLSDRIWGAVWTIAVVLMLAGATLGALVGIIVWAGWWALAFSVVGFLAAFVCGAVRE